MDLPLLQDATSLLFISSPHRPNLQVYFGLLYVTPAAEIKLSGDACSLIGEMKICLPSIRHQSRICGRQIWLFRFFSALAFSRRVSVYGQLIYWKQNLPVDILTNSLPEGWITGMLLASETRAFSSKCALVSGGLSKGSRGGNFKRRIK